MFTAIEMNDAYFVIQFDRDYYLVLRLNNLVVAVVLIRDHRRRAGGENQAALRAGSGPPVRSEHPPSCFAS